MFHIEIQQQRANNNGSPFGECACVEIDNPNDEVILPIIGQKDFGPDLP